MDSESVTLVKGFDFQTDAEGLPIAWENASVPGQSDHLPVTMQIKAVPRTACESMIPLKMNDYCFTFSKAYYKNHKES